MSGGHEQSASAAVSATPRRLFFILQTLFRSVVISGLFAHLVDAGRFPVDPQLYFTTNDGLYRLPTLQPNITPVTLLSGRRYSGLDYYSSSEAGYLVVGDNTKKHIVRVDAQDSNSTCNLVSRSAGATINGVSVDWMSNIVYWISEGAKTIEMVRLDGSLRTVLLAAADGVTVPSALEVWPQKGLLFWADLSRDVIERTALDGSQQRTILTHTRSVRALTIDNSAGKLYWGDTQSDSIFIVNPDGTGNTRLVTSISNIQAIALFKDRVFWIDATQKSLQEASALASDYPSPVPRTSAPGYRPLQTFAESPADLISVDGNKTGTNPCSVNNGGCTHLCLSYPHPLQSGTVLKRCVCSTSSSVQSLCPSNITNPVSQSCSEADLPSTYLVFKTSSALRRLSLVDFSSAKWLNEPSVGGITTVTWNSSLQLIWVNSQTGTIYRTTLDRSSALTSHSRLFQGVAGSVNQIAADSTSQTAYATQINGSLFEFPLNGSAVAKTVVQGNSSVYPFAVAVETNLRILIWISRGVVNVVKSNLDGSAEIYLVRGAAGQPEDIAIKDNTVYWSDSQRNLIEQINLDGTGRQVFLAFNSSFEKFPVGLAVDGSYVYWVSYSLNHSACILQQAKRAQSSGAEVLDSWYGSQPGALTFVVGENKTSATSPSTIATAIPVTSPASTVVAAMSPTANSTTSTIAVTMTVPATGISSTVQTNLPASSRGSSVQTTTLPQSSPAVQRNSPSTATASSTVLPGARTSSTLSSPTLTSRKISSVNEGQPMTKLSCSSNDWDFNMISVILLVIAVLAILMVAILLLRKSYKQQAKISPMGSLRSEAVSLAESITSQSNNRQGNAVANIRSGQENTREKSSLV